jgi:hypothetical protein
MLRPWLVLSKRISRRFDAWRMSCGHTLMFFEFPLPKAVLARPLFQMPLFDGFAAMLKRHKHD